MSQFYISGGVNPPIPPTVATSYVTDINSPAIPAANVLNVFGNSISADNVHGIETDGSSGGNTLTIYITNRLTGSGSTVGAVTADLITFALAASASVYEFTFMVAGKDTAGAFVGNGVGYNVVTCARTDGATATQIGSATIDVNEDAGLAGGLVSLVTSGNNVILRVTGVAGETISYKAVGTYVVV